LALLRRALTLLRAGEVRTLRVSDPTTLAFILSVVVQENEEKVSFDTVFRASASQGADAVVGAAQVIASLRAIEWTGTVRQPEAAFALVERYIHLKHHGAE
jgi:hypothetical protein